MLDPDVRWNHQLEIGSFKLRPYKGAPCEREVVGARDWPNEASKRRRGTDGVVDVYDTLW